MTDCPQTLADTKHFPGCCPKRHSYTMYEADVFWFEKAREQDDTQSRNPRHRCFLFSFSLTMELQEADNLGEEF